MLAFAFGLNCTIGLIGNVLNSSIEPLLGDSIGVPLTLFFGMLILMVSLMAGIGLIFLESKAEKEEKIDKEHIDFDDTSQI